MDSSNTPQRGADNERLVVLPIENPAMWRMYQRARESFWLPREINLNADVTQWNTQLSEDERRLLSRVMAFFATADGLVAENLVERFAQETDIMEAKYFYGFQVMMENIHAEVYALILQQFIPDDRERKVFLHASTELSSVSDKTNWARRWLDRDRSSFGERLIAFACVEGILFQASFALIYWFKQRGLLPGVSHSNDLIARDEALHTEFACLMLQGMEVRPSPGLATKIVREAVNIEVRFIEDVFPRTLAGLPVDAMRRYVEFVADQLLQSMGYTAIFDTKNPLPFMRTIAVPSRTNFFERRNADYRIAGLKESATMEDEFADDAFA